MLASNCLKQVSDGCLKMARSFARHLTRHFSDTLAKRRTKTMDCGCLTNCLKVSDMSESVTVWLAACPLDAPAQTPRQKSTRQAGATA